MTIVEGDVGLNGRGGDAGKDRFLDLVCGPDGPLPEGRQRYRLVGRLGSGGQADVYQGVRLSGGVRSAPVTIKVFRADHHRPVLDQMRSWDKGDAVVMDLNTRGVPGICLRVDGFYGAPPVRSDSTTVLGMGTEQRIPYQVLDYLPGRTLLQHVSVQDAVRNGRPPADGQPVPRLDGVTVLNALARTVALLHRPASGGETPVLHMDVKPSNVIVLPSGEVRLIDFTAARYYDPLHITTIAHTPESGGPEAFTGQVGPAYDVHGFGAVAYHLITGWLPRAENATSHYDGAVAAPGALRRHPLLDRSPRLAAHLLAPLDDKPENRPRSADLVGWVGELGRIAAAEPQAWAHVDWTSSGAAPQVAPPNRTRVAPATLVEQLPAGIPARNAPAAVGAGAAAAGAVGAADQQRKIASGVAKVVPKQKRPSDDGGWEGRDAYPPQNAQPPRYPPPNAGPEPQQAPQQPAGPLRRRGRAYTTFAVVVAAACWLLWLATVAFINTANTGEPVTALGLVIVGAFVVWWLVRLGGHLIRITLDRGPRRGTLVQNLATGTFILLCATVFFARAQGNFDEVGGAVTDWWNGIWPF
jgi:serine/threonine protein kinase